MDEMRALSSDNDRYFTLLMEGELDGELCQEEVWVDMKSAPKAETRSADADGVHEATDTTAEEESSADVKGEGLAYDEEQVDGQGDAQETSDAAESSATAGEGSVSVGDGDWKVANENVSSVIATAPLRRCRHWGLNECRL